MAPPEPEEKRDSGQAPVDRGLLPSRACVPAVHARRPDLLRLPGQAGTQSATRLRAFGMTVILEPSVLGCARSRLSGLASFSANWH